MLAPRSLANLDRMAGPTLAIELDRAVNDAELDRLRRLLHGVSDCFEEERPGSFDLGVVAARLGILDSDREGPRPFVVEVSGPGFGDEDVFHAEHEGTDLRPFIGFAPTHDVGVIAMGNGRVDHAVTALLAAEVMAIVGGVVSMETHGRHAAIARALPGARAQMTDPWNITFGSSELLRAWAAHPEFRLLK